MGIEILLRGYPSRIRFAEWQAANLLPEDKLPKLTAEQQRRASRLHIPERHYAVALKAAELAGEEARRKMERMAQLIATAVRGSDAEAELKSLVWDFYGHQFQFVTRHNGREFAHSIPTAIIDDLLLEKEGAEQRLKNVVRHELGGWAA